MRTGYYISGAGHAVLILLVLFGGLFTPDPDTEFSVTDVSVISEAEFAALQSQGPEPVADTEVPEVVPPAQDTVPDAPSADSAPQTQVPEPVDAPQEPDTSDVEIPDPTPQAALIDEVPDIVPPSDLDGTSDEPDAVAAPAPRVAPVPQVAPPPEAETAPVVVENTAPDPEAEPEPEPVEEQPPAAPDAASDRIVTEAEEVEEFAPASSRRPRSRPSPPVRQAEAEPEPQQPQQPQEDDSDPTADAIAAALAEANAPAEEAPVPAGPPLTGGERDAFRVAVSSCWNVGSLSTEALGTTVIVGVEMSRDARPLSESIRLISSSGGSDGAARQAYEAARRAIIRCGARGFPLPVEKFAQWREIEMTFNPEGMQFR